MKKKIFTFALVSMMMLSVSIPASASDVTSIIENHKEDEPMVGPNGPQFPDGTDFDDSLIVDQEGSEGDNSLLNPDQMEGVKEESKGKIEITLEDGKKGTSKENVELSCLKVAEVKEGLYVLNKEFSDLKLDLNTIKNAKELEDASSKIAKVADKGTLAKTDKDGKVIFDELEVGVYLIMGTNTEKYDDITPTLVSIPTWDEEAEDMSYEITVNPKHSPKPEVPDEDREAPQTNAYSPIVWCFGGAFALLLGLALFNRITKMNKKK